MEFREEHYTAARARVKSAESGFRPKAQRLRWADEPGFIYTNPIDIIK